MTKITILKFLNIIILEICGGGYNFGPPARYFFFFLKRQMIVHEIITINKSFNARFFIYNLL